MKLGDTVAVAHGGVVSEVVAESMRWTSGYPAVYRRLSRLQRAVRALTPQRWRRSLLIQEAVAAGMQINPADNHGGWTAARLETLKGGWR